MQNIYKKIKGLFSHFFTLKDTSHNIAAGFTIGFFLGIIPGGGLLAALVVATFFSWNKAAAAMGALTTNMWGTFIVMPIAAFVGGFLFDITPEQLMAEFYQTYHLGMNHFFTKLIFFDLALPFIVGFVIVAGVISLLVYTILYLLLKHNKIK